ncbi:oligosaccharide flippase family protein [Escherichia coli]|uniref:oligosaccharide flippase family protein n=1 Tax=Escherichia coli TaxID=562 RepID=UPI001C6036A8|nr:oligosaccharide flippase family protein [Escherichia coli]MCZ0470459.1 oligosaccharide flippase family protein [Escherichia coli]HDC8884092.1 oligosaccharide flippase family protein [Escherichia coli]
MFNKFAVLRNFASLGLMQVINYVLPIVIIPFLVNKIGIYNVGLIATFTAIAAYMQLVIDYGFNLSATRNISKDGYDDYHASIISSSVFVIKVTMSLALIALSFFIMKLASNSEEHIITFMFTVGIVVFQSLFPVWHFQAAERMHYITMCNGVPKLISACMIFYFVSSPGDTWKVQACFMLGAAASFILSLFILKSKFNFRLLISFTECKNQIIDGHAIFLARLASGLYKNFNVLILGVFAGTAAVGTYSIAERIIRSAQMVQNVVGDTLYPLFSKEFTGNKLFFKHAADKYKWHIIIFYTLASLAIFYLSGIIGKIMGGASADNVSSCLKIMSIAFLFGGMNYVLAILGLTSCGYAKQFSLCVISAGLFNVLCATFLSFFFSYYGTSVALVLSEFFLLCFVIFYSKRTGIL